MFDESLLLGNTTIDEQHRELFSQLDKISYICLIGCHKVQLKEMLQFLDDYTQKHFSYEEAIMEQINYPNLETQKVQHSIFRQKIKDLQEINIKELGHEKLSLKIKWELLNWYTHHIKRLDKEMVNFIKAQQHY